MQSKTSHIILASTSKYRKEILERTGLSFLTQKPNCNEEQIKEKFMNNIKDPMNLQLAIELAELLSKEKTFSVSAENNTVIGGDQLAYFNGTILGKPKNFQKAAEQLTSMSGQTHELVTAITIKKETKIFHLNHLTRLKMKDLTPKEIENYLKIDEPYDCAGSYKIEKSGICLFEKIDTDDFTAIQGLPLIWLTKIMKELGHELFSH